MTATGGTAPIRLGVLGCADVAWRRTLPALPAAPGLQLAAVASRDAAKAARFANRFGGDPVTGYDRLLARRDIEAVYLPLPAVMHAPWVERALRAGKHVLVEKPLATRASDAHRLVALAAERGLVLAENFMFVLHAQHEEVRKLLAGGLIGQPRVFTAAFAIPARPAGDMRYRPDVGGGALADIGGYPLRAATLLLGADVEVVGAVLGHDSTRGVDLSGGVLLSTPDGVTAHLTFGMEHAYRCEYELWGTAGRLRLDRAFTPPPDHVPVLRLERDGRVEERHLVPDDQFANVLRAFYRAIREGTDSDLQATAILRQADLVERVRAVARQIVR